MRDIEKYSAKLIDSQIKKLSSRIKLSQGDVILILMNGGAMFGHSLLSYNGFTQLRVEYAKLSSYDGQNRGEIKEIYSPDFTTFKDRRVIVLDDICDSGNTLRYIHDKLKEAEVDTRNVWYYTVIKRDGANLYKDMQYECLIEDHSEDFFYGFGMDSSDGTGRNLKYIGVE